jgi:hypothetical protein
MEETKGVTGASRIEPGGLLQVVNAILCPTVQASITSGNDSLKVKFTFHALSSWLSPGQVAGDGCPAFTSVYPSLSLFKSGGTCSTGTLPVPLQVSQVLSAIP